MTTRACDFSSFRRPLRPSNNTSVTNSPQSTTGRSDSTAQNLQNPTVENQSSHTTSSTTMNSNARRLMASHSVGPSARPSNYDYLSGSIPRFHGVSSPSMSSFSPNPNTTFSSQNLEQFSSYDRRPSKAINHSTIDRSTLPYDRKQSTPDESERSNNLSRQEERSSGSGSGLVFLDGGKRGVMSADSQHSLNGSLSGHRMDRSLAHRQHSAVNNMKDSFEYDGGYDTHPRQQRNDVMHQYNSVQRYHAGQYQPDHSAYMDDGQRGGYVGNNDNEIIGNYNSVGGAVMSQSPYVNNVMSSRHHNVIRGSPHNVSSGESGIAGCDFNTLGARSYDTYAGGAVDSPAGYAAAVSSSHGRYASVGGRLASNSSAAMHAVSQSDNQTGIYDPHQQHSQLQYAAGSQGSNGSNRSSNTAESSLTARGDCNQQTLLIPSGSALRLNTSADESVTVYDHSHPFSFSPYQQQQQQQTSSVPKINTRVPSRRSQNKGFNLFKKGKKRDKRADDIYTKNNLYAPSGKKSSQVTLGSAGATTTGLSFSAKYTGAMKRPFCPRWQCIALAAAVGIAFLLCIGMVIYFYVWPSVLQPLVESSKPVDGEWGEWTPWFQCSATCGQGNQHRTRECNSPSPEDGGRECVGLKNEMRNCSAPVECPDCTRVCTVGTLSNDCRQCTCEGHVITGRILDEYGDPLPGVKVYKNTGAALLLSGTDNNGEFRFEGVCSNGDNELKLVKEMYRVSIVTPTQQESDEKAGYVLFTMIKLYLPHFITSPESQQRLVGQKVVLCCEAQSEQPPTKYVWYKDNTKLDPAVYKYSLQQTSLALPNLADWENGDYTCEVHNEAGVVNSKPATLTVYRNWTDLCHPKPADKFISLPDGCSQRTFNTGTCAKDIPVSTTESSSAVVTGGYHPQCISRDQYPSNEDDNTCPVKNDASRYCCKPLQEKEISVSCTLKEIGQPYNMALKRIVSCGCVLC